MNREDSAEAVKAAVRAVIAADIPIEVDVAAGEVRVGRDADPQIVSFAIEGAGYRVEEVR